MNIQLHMSDKLIELIKTQQQAKKEALEKLATQEAEKTKLLIDRRICARKRTKALQYRELHEKMLWDAFDLNDVEQMKLQLKNMACYDRMIQIIKQKRQDYDIKIDTIKRTIRDETQKVEKSSMDIKKIMASLGIDDINKVMASLGIHQKVANVLEL